MMTELLKGVSHWAVTVGIRWWKNPYNCKKILDFSATAFWTLSVYDQASSDPCCCALRIQFFKKEKNHGLFRVHALQNSILGCGRLFYPPRLTLIPPRQLSPNLWFNLLEYIFEMKIGRFFFPNNEYLLSVWHLDRDICVRFFFFFSVKWKLLFRC